MRVYLQFLAAFIPAALIAIPSESLGDCDRNCRQRQNYFGRTANGDVLCYYYDNPDCTGCTVSTGKCINDGVPTGGSDTCYTVSSSTNRLYSRDGVSNGQVLCPANCTIDDPTSNGFSESTTIVSPIGEPISVQYKICRMFGSD